MDNTNESDVPVEGIDDDVSETLPEATPESVVTVEDPENDTYTDYTPQVPRYHVAESLYRAEATTDELDNDGDHRRFVLEWDSIDGKMSLAHWQNPDRIIPLTGHVSDPESESDTEENDDMRKQSTLYRTLMNCIVIFSNRLAESSKTINPNERTNP